MNVNRIKIQQSSNKNAFTDGYITTSGCYLTFCGSMMVSESRNTVEPPASTSVIYKVHTKTQTINSPCSLRYSLEN